MNLIHPHHSALDSINASLIPKAADRNDINSVFAAIGILAHGSEYHKE